MKEWDPGNIEGLIPIVGGVFALLTATGAWPLHPKNPEKMAQWRARFGPLLKIVAPLVIIFGLLQLTGIL